MSRSDITAKTRDVVWIRDEGRCVGCGLYLTREMWHSIQHRLRRQVGGNGLANLILMCGSATSDGCHRKAEDRLWSTERLGYWIKANTKPVIDPQTVPVFYAYENAWYLLDDTGVRVICDAPKAAVT